MEEEDEVDGEDIPGLDELYDLSDGFPRFDGYKIYDALGEDDLADLALIHAMFGEKKRVRKIKTSIKRRNWEEYSQQLIDTNEFHSRFRMNKDHFDYLLSYISPAITVNFLQSACSTGGNEPIYPDNIMAMGLRFCSGPSTIPDIVDVYGISTASAKRCVNMFLDAIDYNTDCEELQVQLPNATDLDALNDLAGRWSDISTAFGLFKCNLGAIDGWLPRTEMPRDVSNQVDYFSGHYHCYGLNVQAMCDPDLSFLYLSVAAPGKVNDIRAFYRCGLLLDWLDALPPEFYIVGDNAYPLSRRILIPFSGADYFDEHNRTYNFYLSQM